METPHTASLVHDGHNTIRPDAATRSTARELQL